MGAQKRCGDYNADRDHWNKGLGMAFDWKALGSQVASIGLPLIGAALAGPGGAAIGTALASHLGLSSGKPENILAALTSDANQIAKAREFELANQTKLIEIAVNAQIEARKADSADIASVNATMTAEAVASANETWFQKGWRPLNGYVVGLTGGFAVVFICYLCYLGVIAHDAAALGAIPAVAMAITGILAVPGAAVGITAWHRGVGQVEQIKQGGV
jgi:roadblock/LC7 domain-containing protein